MYIKKIKKFKERKKENLSNLKGYLKELKEVVQETLKNLDDIYKNSKYVEILGILAIIFVVSQPLIAGLKDANNNKYLSPEKVKEYLENTEELSAVGCIKDGENFIPYCIIKNIFGEKKVYNLKNGHYIGCIANKTNYEEITLSDFITGGFEVILDANNNVLFVQGQWFDFKDCYPNVNYSKELIESFTEEDFKRFEEIYHEKSPIFCARKFQLENIKTGEQINVIGYQITATKFYNIISRTIEDYEEFNINKSSLAINIDDNIDDEREQIAERARKL